MLIHTGRWLELSRNSLSGTIPSTISTLTRVTYVVIPPVSVLCTRVVFHVHVGVA